MTERLPLFPLNTVLYPGLVLPLHVFEERYRRLVGDLSAQPADEPRRFGVVAIRAGSEVAVRRADSDPEPGSRATDGFGDDPMSALHVVGCMAEIASMQRERGPGGGRLDLVSTGTVRFRLRSIDATGPYLVGEVEPLQEREGDADPVLVAGAVGTFQAYQRRLAATRERTVSGDQELPGDPQVLSYLIAAASVLDVTVKQRLLAAPDAAQRLHEEITLLRAETAIIAELPSLPATELMNQETCLN